MLAAGGFEANLDWLERAWGPAARNFLIRGTPYNTGTVLKLMLDAGAAPIGDARECHAVAIDGRAPKFDGGIVTRLDCVPLGIVVNAEAERFYDEGEDFWPKRYAIWGKLVARQPGQIAYSIIDAKVRDRFMPSVYPPIEAAYARRARGASSAYRPSGSRRRSRRSIAPCNRARSITRRSTTAAPPASRRRSRTGRSALDTPPYAAYPLRPGITFTYLGVRVDASARVLATNGAAVRERLCGRRDHGRQRAAQRLYCGHRHDDRHRVRAHCRRERSTTCKRLS